MKNVTAFVFGFNNYATEIIDNIIQEYAEVHLFSLEKKDEEYKKNKIQFFDLDDEWTEVKELKQTKNSIAFCALEDDAMNIFLTISLRASFDDLVIVSLAKNKESANKLEIAGANRVIPIVKTTADIISNMMNRPIATKVLHNILYEKSNLKIAQIIVQNAEAFHREFPADIDWSRYHGIIVLSIIHKDMSEEFIYSSQTKHKLLVDGDILVVTGYEADIAVFEKSIGRRHYVNWGDWSW